MVGRDVGALYGERPIPEHGPVALEVEGLTRRRNARDPHAIELVDVSLRAHKGEILGLAGLVGAGRTELARILFGLTPADTGVIHVRGRPVSINSPAQAIAHGIAYVPEDRRRHGVIPEMSVATNATLAILRTISRFGLIDGARERRIAEGFVEQLGVRTPSVDTPVANLSGGNQQKVALARWIAAGPAVLILDEPTQGIDVGAKAEIHRLMGELAGRGLAVLMISSELPEVFGMSDRIAVMHGGTIVATLDRQDATQEQVLELALGHVGSASTGAT